MPRVKRPRPTAFVQDRPSRWQVLRRRMRRTLAPVAIIFVLVAIVGAGAGLVRVFGTGESFRERVGHATAPLGLKVRDVVIEGRQKTPDRCCAPPSASAPATRFSPIDHRSTRAHRDHPVGAEREREPATARHHRRDRPAAFPSRWARQRLAEGGPSNWAAKALQKSRGFRHRRESIARDLVAASRREPAAAFGRAKDIQRSGTPSSPLRRRPAGREKRVRRDGDGRRHG